MRPKIPKITFIGKFFSKTELESRYCTKHSKSSSTLNFYHSPAIRPRVYEYTSLCHLFGRKLEIDSLIVWRKAYFKFFDVGIAFFLLDIPRLQGRLNGADMFQIRKPFLFTVFCNHPSVYQLFLMSLT